MIRILLIILICQFLPINSSDSSDRKRLRTEESKSVKTQEERDRARLRTTQENIEDIIKTLPTELSQEIKDMIICQQLLNWDARVAYEHNLISFNPQRLITIYTALEPIFVIKESDERDQISPERLYTMSTTEQNNVRPTEIVQYLLALNADDRRDATNARNAKRILDHYIII